MKDEVRRGGRLATVGLLAAGVAHDVNNLLTVIDNYAGLALAGGLDAPPPDTERWRRLLADIEQIHRAARRGGALTCRLLGYARAESTAPVPVKVGAVVADTLTLLRGSFRNGVEIELDLAPDGWPVLADPVGLGQVVVNLVGNAVDAMPDGGTLTIRTSNVAASSVRAAAAADADADSVDRPRRRVLLEVLDTGCGIASDLLDLVFEPCFTTKPAGRGTGIGLVVVREYVAEHDGTVTVESTPGVGTRFAVLLPASVEAAAGDGRGGGADTAGAVGRSTAPEDDVPAWVYPLDHNWPAVSA